MCFNSSSADEINYKIRFTAKAWNDELADPTSEKYRTFVDEITQHVSVGTI